MMQTIGRDVTANRLKDLERTVFMLDGRLKDVQQEIQHARNMSMTERLWTQVVGQRSSRIFMSAVCSRYARPNRKVVAHDHANH